MAWEGSTRKETLPPNWDLIRQAVLERDGFRCVYQRSDGRRCSATTRLEIDHTGDRLDHRIEMLRTLCSWHHIQKSSSQGGTANAEKRRTKLRDHSQKHPGLR